MYTYIQIGQVDVVFPTVANEDRQATQSRLEAFVCRVAALLSTATSKPLDGLTETATDSTIDVDSKSGFDYTRSRRMDRPQTQDIIANIFDNASFVELSGDGCVGRDVCLRGGLATLGGKPCVVVGTYKGHSPTTMQASNYGMSSPHGYRTALRLMQLAERFKLPVITLVDTVGAWPTFGKLVLFC
jgi:acetyl-CoA carboxylase alpha subunit